MMSNTNTESLNPSSKSVHSSDQENDQTRPSYQTQMQNHNSGKEDTQLPTLSQLSESIHKAMSVISHANCADEINRDFITKIMEQVEEMVNETTYHDETAKAQMDALGTRLWNSALIIRADAGENAEQEIILAVAFIRRTACLLLNVCRMEKEDIESSQRIVTVCARTAMDLQECDERVMAEEMIQMAAECVAPLEKIDNDANVFDDGYKDSVFEAVCAYRLARFQLSIDTNEAVMTHFMHKALDSCKKLMSDCWVSRATLKFAIELAIKVIDEQEKIVDDVQSDVTKLKEVKISLENIQIIIEKKPYAQNSAYNRSRLDVALLLSRIQYITAKMEGNETNNLMAEKTLHLAVKIAKESGQKAEATKIGLLILSMMEERRSNLELMFQEWRNLLPDFNFEEAHIERIVKVLFRTSLRKPDRFAEYILKVINSICQCLLSSDLDPVSCATHVGKLGFVAVSAAGLECTSHLKDFFDAIEQVELTPEMVHAWLDILLRAADSDEDRNSKKATNLLALAYHPLFHKMEIVAYTALKKAAYFHMQAGRHEECKNLITQKIQAGDLPSSLILCISFIRQRKEIEARKILDHLQASEWDANVLLWIVSEAFAQGMTALQCRAMEMFVSICPATYHDLNHIRLLRTVVSKYIDLLYTTEDPVEDELFDAFATMIGRYDTMIYEASRQDKQSKEKADEADWIIASLYKLAIDCERFLSPAMLEKLNHTIVQIADIREQFEQPCHPQIYVLRFYAGFRSLLNFKKSITSIRHAPESSDRLGQAWTRAIKCEKDLNTASTVWHYSPAKDNAKLALLSVKVDILLDLENTQEIQRILQNEVDPLDHEATEEVAMILLQHPSSQPSLLQAAVKRLINFFREEARANGSYPAPEVTQWLKHTLDKHLKYSHGLVYDQVIELLDDILIPLWKDAGLVATPNWPSSELFYFQYKARELAEILAKQGKIEPAFKLINISADILHNLPGLPKPTLESEMARLHNINDVLQKSQHYTVPQSYRPYA